jgi:hypothetical protein
MYGTEEHRGLCSQHHVLTEEELEEHNRTWQPPPAQHKVERRGSHECCGCHDCRVCLLPCMLCCPNLCCTVM